jgi:hypothetical protein
MGGEMAKDIRDVVTRYLSGESTYPEALSSLASLIGSKQAHDMLRCAVEAEDETYLSLAPVAAA